jgi:hypothetical protein
MFPSRFTIGDGDAMSCPSGDVDHFLEFRVFKGLNWLLCVVNKEQENLIW